MKTIEELKAELLTVQARIKRAQPSDYVLDNMPARIGGSGRYTNYFNKRREAYLDRSIEAAKKLTPLYEKESNLKKQIEDIESGAAEKKELSIIQKRQQKAEYWRSIKPGDEVALFTGNTVTVKKKNRLSIETSSGSKYTAAEIIGREAAKLL